MGNRISMRFITKKFFAGIFWITVILLTSEEIQARTVRIGVYDNPPKVEINPGGAPRGIFVDIINYIAKQEGWDIKYVPLNWDKGLAQIENATIDLMPDVAYSDSRAQRFDFNKLTVLASWFQVFCRKGLVMESVSDLNGKTVAVLKGSIQERVCEDISKKMGLKFNLIALLDYDSTIKQVASGKADAIVVSRFYGYKRKHNDALIPTPVILYPTTLCFAAPKGRNQDLLAAIDKHMAEILCDEHSIYYKSLIYWLDEKPRFFIPPFVVWSIISLSITLLILFVVSIILRWQIKKRTEDLAKNNQQLLEALQELKIAKDEAIKRERLYAFGQLACGVAHDFNNLLTPISGFVDLMLSNPQELENKENAKRNLEAIKSATKHGTEIVRRMQQFYRSASVTETKGIVDINSVIREVVQLAKLHGKNKISTKKPQIKYILKLGTLPKFTGRSSGIHEMLLNLVLNAADAMPEGGNLEISTESIKNATRITVKDSGVGMSEEVTEKCLQPFFTTKGAEGTGMGLTIVNSIAAEHGGNIEIRSKVGTGTSIMITLPFAHK